MLGKKLFVFLFVVWGIQGEEERPVVKTTLGKVSGYHQVANGGRKFSAFEGIPYAKPPTGERRFQPPEAVEPWIGVWDAIFVTQCVQTGFVKVNAIEGEEDCLYLNVYVPRASPSSTDKLDVIVHFHGGAFMFGSAHSYAHPEFLMDREVVFVSVNYRVGLFGFMSTEDDVVSGNNGLKDQVMALKWIQKNIASFGGNPKSVTLTGLSAGGASVQYHYLSDMSKGLFHRGFSQSGVALNPWALQEAAATKAKTLAEAVGCSSSYSQVFVQCLKQRHYRHLISKMHLFYGFQSLPFSPFGPVVEKGSTPFLNKHPYELLVKGQSLDLPWIVSNTVHEGMLPAAYLHKDVETINADWNKLGPFLFDYNYTAPASQHQLIAEKIRKFYFDDKEVNIETYPKLVELFTHRLFTGGAEEAARLQAKNSRSPVYYYKFGYPGDHSQNKTVSHADDAQYFFFNMFQRKKLSPNEMKMKEIMLDMLISYAINGKPTVTDVDWKPTGHDKLTYLKIDTFDIKQITVEEVDELTPLEFWKSLGLQENENLVHSKDEL